jgi:hypothetical protein
MARMKIAPTSAAYLNDWAEMRAALWPELSFESLSDIAKLFLAPSPRRYFFALVRRSCSGA